MRWPGSDDSNGSRAIDPLCSETRSSEVRGLHSWYTRERGRSDTSLTDQGEPVNSRPSVGQQLHHGQPRRGRGYLGNA
ncbi:hypothetical protein N7510_007720 [Penicillium lagena]|uniref:uncharacterized protein n=1 Tax=Penicillium lagena TaxID=94218 RepID=UPI0025419E30|nr:uncharacterized protein N7510_007720 [Penicillium lagena]KAJ5611001.1 hypothetical protein N7510_007720 [Penicillium lagena]